MKRFLMLVLALAGFTLAASAQNGELMSVDLTNGTTLSGYVTQQSDGGYLVQTAEGDTFYYSASEVRRVYDPNEKQDPNAVFTDGRRVYRKGKTIRYADDNSAIGPTGFANYMAYDKYTKASKLKQWGDYSLILGTLFVLGGVGDMMGDEPDGTYMWAIPVGTAVQVAGAAMEVIGLGKLNKIVRTRNNALQYSFEVGPTPNGFGIAMRF